LALAAFCVAAGVRRSRFWLAALDRRLVVVFLMVGIVLTVAFEFYYTQVTHRWTYSNPMPLIPPFGTGASPLIQWIMVPLLVVEMMRAPRCGRPQEPAWATNQTLAPVSEVAGTIVSPKVITHTRT